MAKQGALKKERSEKCNDNLTYHIYSGKKIPVLCSCLKTPNETVDFKLFYCKGKFEIDKISKSVFVCVCDIEVKYLDHPG